MNKLRMRKIAIVLDLYVCVKRLWNGYLASFSIRVALFCIFKIKNFKTLNLELVHLHAIISQRSISKTASDPNHEFQR